MAWNLLYLGTFDEAAILLTYVDGVWIVAEQIETTPEAMIVGTISNKEFRSPFAAPYGGLLVLAAEIDMQDCVEALVSYLFATFRIEQISIRIATEPIFLQGSAHLTLTELCTQVHHEPTYLVDVEKWTIDLLSSGNRKRLRQSLERSLVSCELDATHVDSIYNTLSKNREAIGVQMPVTRDRLLSQIEALPHKYSLHATFSGAQMVASAVVVELLPGIAYVFMWGETPDHRSWSPVVTLFVHIVDWARERNYRFLDLGTASLGGQPNLGLVRFKMNLGATESVLYEFSFWCDGDA